MTDAGVELTTGGIAHGGHVVARLDGRVVFVRHALPGERVRVRLTDARPQARYWRADAVSVLEGSPDRVDSAWPEAGPGGVGGGELAHVALPAQRDWKLTVLRDAFVRFAGQEFPGDVSAAPMDDARAGLGYRTRVTAVADASGTPGMHPHRSEQVVAVTAMPLATAAVEETLLSQRAPAGSRITVAGPAAGGPVRVMVDGQPWLGRRAATGTNAPRSVHESVTAHGHTWAYRVAVDGFWQVHREAPSLLVDQVLTAVGDAGQIVDLYAGAGLFTVPLASTGRQVTAVEADDQAVRFARRNLHDVASATVVHGDVRQTLAGCRSGADAVVLDPPRSGAGAATVERIAALAAPSVVYVACDPVALARDVRELARHGYALTGAQAFDLFPMTHHVETVATFQLR